jgi:TolB protein
MTRRRARAWFAIGLAAAVAGAATVLLGGQSAGRAGSAPAPVPLAFARFVAGDGDIWIRTADGERRLTHGPADDSGPSWSPGARAIAFERATGRGVEVWVATVDGTTLRRISGDGSAPAWSPTGAVIAYTGSVRGRDGIVLTAPAGGEHMLVTRSLDAIDSAPAWSPDGRRIAFVRSFRARGEVWVMEADGSRAHQLMSTDGQAGWPAWSPDGDRLAYVRRGDLHVVSADGGGDHALTAGPAWDGEPAWSADGRTIVFWSDRDGRPRLYAVPAGGGPVRPLAPAVPPAGPDDPADVAPAPAPGTPHGGPFGADPARLSG